MGFAGLVLCIFPPVPPRPAVMEAPIEGPTPDQDTARLKECLDSINRAQGYIQSDRDSDRSFGKDQVDRTREQSREAMLIRLRRTLQEAPRDVKAEEDAKARGTTREEDIKALTTLVMPVQGRDNQRGILKWYDIVCESEHISVARKARLLGEIQVSRSGANRDEIESDVRKWAKEPDRLNPSLEVLLYDQHFWNYVPEQDRNGLFKECIDQTPNVKVILYNFLSAAISDNRSEINVHSPLFRPDSPMKKVVYTEHMTIDLWIEYYIANLRKTR